MQRQNYMITAMIITAEKVAESIIIDKEEMICRDRTI